VNFYFEYQAGFTFLGGAVTNISPDGFGILDSDRAGNQMIGRFVDLNSSDFDPVAERDFILLVKGYAPLNDFFLVGVVKKDEILLFFLQDFFGLGKEVHIIIVDEIRLHQRFKVFYPLG
jgi:hypothetical protein